MIFDINKYKRKQINSLVFSLFLGVLFCLFMILNMNWIILAFTHFLGCFFFLKFIFSCFEIKDINSWNGFSEKNEYKSNLLCPYRKR